MNMIQLMGYFKKFDLETVGLLKGFSERAQASGDTVGYVKESLKYLKEKADKIPTVVVNQVNNVPRIKR